MATKSTAPATAPETAPTGARFGYEAATEVADELDENDDAVDEKVEVIKPEVSDVDDDAGVEFLSFASPEVPGEVLSEAREPMTRKLTVVNGQDEAIQRDLRINLPKAGVVRVLQNDFMHSGFVPGFRV